MKQKHQPVLLPEVLELLDPKPGQSYLDGTAGYGGHASAVIKLIGSSGQAVLVDRDSDAVASLRVQFGSSVEVIQTNYFDAVSQLVARDKQFDMILLDLGVSSPQFDEVSRGFSFKGDAPLDMRMDRRQDLSANDVVNRYSETDLASVIFRYGDEPRSRRIASAIVAGRPISTTTELARIVRKIVPGNGAIDPATRTFQAIRVEVNDELGNLSASLPLMVELLAPDGRIAVISFHSLEDRIVKQFFELESRDCICPPKQPICTCGHIATLKKLTPRPISGLNDNNNPRARSAKLRAAVKLKPKPKGG